MYLTFEYTTDRGPKAWARFATEQIQLGCEGATEGECWDSLIATIGETRAANARIVSREPDLNPH